MIIAALLAIGSTTAAPPSAVELTAYNAGFGLVKETRELNLSRGEQTIAIEDVAQRIEPTSVAIKPLGSGSGFSVLEQSYQYDLITTQAILQKAVGTVIKFHRTLPDGKKEILEGMLMSAPTAIVGGMGAGSNTVYNGMVIKLNDGRIILDPSGEIEVREIPNGLISTPTLVWTVDAPAAGKQSVLLTYLTGGITWNADYVISLDKAGKTGNVKGWVTMNNQSGTSFADAKLKLLAGEVHRAPQERAGRVRNGDAMDMAPMAAKAMVEEQFADYHLYTVTRPTTVRNNEIKQISLLEAFNIPITKKLVLDSTGMYGTYYPSESSYGVGPAKPKVWIEFKNDTKSHMGMPLPAGNFKVFQEDSSGSVQMLGEDHIDHTPKDEKVSLFVGEAFDVTSVRKRTEYKVLRNGNNSHGTRETFEIEVRNRKEESQAVTVLEHHWGDWKVTAKSQDFVKLDSNTMQFVVDLKPNETKTVAYTVETYW